jgi:hypothetical protein
MLTPGLASIFYLRNANVRNGSVFAIQFCRHALWSGGEAGDWVDNEVFTPKTQPFYLKEVNTHHRRDSFCVRASLSWEAWFQVRGGVISCPPRTEFSGCATRRRPVGAPESPPFAFRLSPSMVVGVPPFQRYVTAGAFSLSRRTLARSDRIVCLFPIPDSHPPGVR